MGVADNIINAADHLWHKTASTAGFCSANINTVNDYLEKGQTYATRASQLAGFVAVNSEIAAQLKKGADAIDKIKKPISMAKNVCSNISAAQDLSDAIYVLNQWVRTPPGVDNAVAAKAFDKLFGATARFAEKLPTPLNAYSRILNQISISGFFSNMQRMMDLESDATPTGRAMRNVMDELDAQGRP